MYFKSQPVLILTEYALDLNIRRKLIINQVYRANFFWRSAQGISRWLSGIAAARLIQLNHLTTAGVAGSSLPVTGVIHIRFGGRITSPPVLTRACCSPGITLHQAWGPGNSSPEIRFVFLIFFFLQTFLFILHSACSGFFFFSGIFVVLTLFIYLFFFFCFKLLLKA